MLWTRAARRRSRPELGGDLEQQPGRRSARLSTIRALDRHDDQRRESLRPRLERRRFVDRLRFARNAAVDGLGRARQDAVYFSRVSESFCVANQSTIAGIVDSKPPGRNT